ncbi:hypothetical protein JOC85_003621 [Bacillus mesophilus]|uniref:DUF1963 domain-containing protein n=1 Tax=Bacillus mesophilus TaxID=1808955 RepID=A0A6M0QAI4_9BACI|nr:hypothetical protein [Bacillus mesophilus]MBM7662810.1 hypothetical protein [Bacillus mesophilus]NEY73401.1 hypothetical protein [Bacillus mesophilus]
MDVCYALDIEENDTESSCPSFVGGKPNLPLEQAVPECQLCSSQLTFFFQISFPYNHKWEDLSMAVFACTSCVHKEYLIPEMLEGVLEGINIPKGFLTVYQRNFRILVFRTGEAVTKDTYQEKIKYKPIKLRVTNDLDIYTDKLGGNPNWLLDNEAPAMYDGNPMFFLMQILEDYKFEILSDASPQIKLDLNGEPAPSQENYYELFLGNNLYFFGTEDKTNSMVYLISQI